MAKRFTSTEAGNEDGETAGPFASFTDLLAGVVLIFVIMVVLLALSQGVDKIKAFPDLPESKTGGGNVTFDPNAKGGVGNTPVIRFDKASRMLFGPQSAELTEIGRSEIDKVLPRVAKVVRDSQANQITIVGSTSPTFRSPKLAAINHADASDSNIDLSALRAIALVHYLAKKGVPYRCMVAEARGFSRTTLPESDDILSGVAKRNIGGIEEKYKDERAVEIFVDRTKSTCTSDRLQKALPAE